MSDESYHASLLEIRRICSDYIHTAEFKRFITTLDNSITASQQTTLTVLSQFPGEGKSFLTCAIASAFVGFFGKRVLVVDATKDGTQSNLLSLLISSFNAQHEGQFTLDLISARGIAGGFSGQTEFRLNRGFANFSGSYDRIVIDTVSLQESENASVDPIIVAKQSGQGLLVTSPLSLHVESVKGLTRELMGNQVPLIGTVYFGGVGA